MQIKFGTLFPE